MRRVSVSIAAAFVLLALGRSLARVGQERAPAAPPPALAEADRAWRERSYAKALEGYRRALDAGRAGDRADELTYRCAVALGRTRQWDAALETARQFVAAHPSGPWGARGQYWLGQLLTVLPHEGYRVGGKVYRGEDYPEVQTAEKPERASFWQEDRAGALAAFEAAKRLFEGRPEIEQEEADLNFDLARQLQQEDLSGLAIALTALEREKRPELALRWGSEMRPDPDLVNRLREHDWALAPRKPYDPAQPLPQRILGLLLQIETLDGGRRAPQARLARAIYLAQYQQTMSGWMQALHTKTKQWVPLPFPYEKDDPLALMLSVGNQFPKSAVAPQAQLLAGRWLENRDEYVRALAVYRELVKRWPDGKYVSDAKGRIQEIEWPGIRLGASPARPGDKAQLQFSGRNVKTVEFAAYRVKLQDLLLAKQFLTDPDLAWDDWPTAVGWDEAKRWRRRQKVASWQHVTADTGEHKWLSGTVTTPLTRTGAYLIEAESGEARSLALLLISDIAIIQQQDRDRAIAFVCSAQTGKPIPGADVVLRERYMVGDNWHVHTVRARSDADGIAGKDFVRPANSHNSNVQALAWVGDRYAATAELSVYGRHQRPLVERSAYLHTDRPVYRPGQTVQFRAVVEERTVGGENETRGAWHPAANTTFEAEIQDPKGETVYQAVLTSDEFGSLNGSVRLAPEAALGRYSFSLMQSGAPYEVVDPVHGGQFRVEEYKKPEFEVTVAPAAEQARVGERVSATVKARYYFGSPVVGGQVKYRVWLAPFYPQYQFPRPYDWLTARWRGGAYYRGYHSKGEPVQEGEGRTNEQGELEVTFPAEPGSQYESVRAFEYTIEAEVTDESRRTITGSGAVRVSRQRLFPFLDLKQGFYQVGDRIELEVMTLDVMERPLSARGTVTIERVAGRAARDYVFAREHAEAVATNRDGRAFLRWTPQRAGEYRFTFEANDDWAQTVKGETRALVHGPDSARATFRLNTITVVPDKESYELGETCKLLLVSDRPDMTVLLTQQAGNHIIGKLLVRVEEKTSVLRIPIRPGHEPNFYFHAVAVNDWQAFADTREVFVPPARQFLNVSVTSDRADYRPGEKATFTIRATDHQGRPVRAQFSVGLLDASLYYIQEDTAPDPRLAFYGDRRYGNIEQNWSLQWRPFAPSATDRKRQEYRRHEWSPPEDMGQLQDWPQELVGQWPPEVNYLGLYGRFKGPGGPAGGEYGGRGGGMAGGGGGRGGMGSGGAVTMDSAFAAHRSLSPAATAGVALLQASPGEALAFNPPGPPALPEAPVRTRFADTAFWSPSLVTAEDGTASFTVTMPENLTQWRAVARGFTTSVEVGEATAEVVTRKDVIVRLQAPRFFMERDLVTLSANVHNYLKSDKQAKVTLTLQGGTLELVKHPPADLALKQPAAEEEVWVNVPKNGQTRVDWVVRVLRSGTATVRVTAQTDEESDAMEMEFPALVHGVEKFEAQSGAVRISDGEQTVRLTLSVPKERRRGATELNLQLTPSLAVVALDTLPYLADYPYGCIEQTLSRFLPAAVVARTLAEQGISLDDLQQRQQTYASELQGGSPPQWDSGYTYPKGMPGSFDAGRMTPFWRPPVFSGDELREMVRAGLARVYSMQNGDGGWGWFPGNASDPYMTAYACYGLFAAREAGYDINDDALERGFQFLMSDMKEDDDLHRMAFVASVVTLRGRVSDEVRQVIADRLFRNRGRLTAYSQALLAIALKQMGDTGKARTMLDNLLDTAHIDRANGTCNWMPEQRGWRWWRWWDNPVETNAAVVRAMLAVEPDHELLPMVVKWMVNNRRGNRWASTKETAFAVYALADYLRVKKELAPDYTISVDFDGKVQRTYRVTRDNALLFDNRFIVDDQVIGDGPHTLTITVKGRGALYYSAYLKYFTLEEDIKGTGSEIAVRRRYFRLTPKLVERTSAARTWRELQYQREELDSRAWIKSGDLIEVELVIEAKNEYEYVVFEDMKPAGCEPVEVQSGYRAGEGAGVWPYLELRDEKVAAFLHHLPQGTRAVRYRLRAEIPGEFHALPTNGYSMYAPEVRCLSDEWRVGIAD